MWYTLSDSQTSLTADICFSISIPHTIISPPSKNIVCLFTWQVTEQLTLVAGSVRLQKQGDRFDTTCGILDRAGGFSFWWHSTSTCGERLSIYLDVPTLGAMACTFCDCPVSLIRSGWDDSWRHLHPQTLSFRYWFPRRLTSSFLGLNVPLHGHAFCCYWGTASSMQTKGYQLSFW